MFLAPLVVVVPFEAASIALVIVGFLMMYGVALMFVVYFLRGPIEAALF